MRLDWIAHARVGMALVVALATVGCGDGQVPEAEDLAVGTAEPVEPVETTEPEEEVSPGTEQDGEVDPAVEPPEDDDDDGEDGEEGEDGEDDEEPSPQRRSVIAWLLSLGPSAPAGPSEFRAYEHLMTLDCAGLMERLDDDEHDEALSLQAQSEVLYRAAGSACLAAFEGRSELWAAAGDLAALAGEGTGSCLDRATRRLLDDLLAAHEADPDARFEPATGAGEAQAPPCPRIDHLDPDAGPRDGQVRVVGEHLDVVDEVWLYVGDDPIDVVDGDELDLARVSSGELLLELDAPGVSSLCIILHTVPDWDADAAVYSVEEDPEDGPLEEVPETACPPSGP